MSAAHTRGPWEASDRGDYGDFDGDSRVILGDDIRIAAVHDTGNEEAEANARLIEAAPDMLKALEKAQTVLDVMAGEGIDIVVDGVGVDSADLYTENAAVIAKAKGEQP